MAEIGWKYVEDIHTGRKVVMKLSGMAEKVASWRGQAAERS